LLTQIDGLSLAGIVGGVLSIGAAIGGGIAWWVKTVRSNRKEVGEQETIHRKDSIGEYQVLLEFSRADIDRLITRHRIETERYDVRIKDLEDKYHSQQEISLQAVTLLEDKVNTKLVAAGKKPFIPIANVIAERHSPVTKEAQETADITSLRARLTAAALALDIPPREPGVPETDDQRTERESKEKEKAIKNIAIMDKARTDELQK